MDTNPTRRDFLTGVAVAGVSLATVSSAPAANERPAIKYSFNTSTIRGQKLSIDKEVEIAAKAGYDGIEPWIRELDDYVKAGGNLKELAKKIKDSGLAVVDAIGFAEWIVDDDARRAKGLEEAKRTMDLVAQLGSPYIAAPPAGATKEALDLKKVVERYAKLLELGDKMGVTPQLEVWGFSKTLTRLSDCVFVAMETGHRSACVLPDVYHLYKGGTPFESLKQMGGAGVHVFHFNDYPTKPPREEITDAHRIYPGEGAAPWETIGKYLKENGFAGVVSLELFNPEYYKQDALEVAKTGLAKMKGAIKF